MKHHLSLRFGPLRLLLWLAFFSFGANAHAATFTVNSTADTSDGVCNASNCTLREAITAANAQANADNIVFSATMFQSAKSIALATTLPYLTGEVTITGPGAKLLRVQEGDTNQSFNVFGASAGAKATFSGLSIGNGINGIYISGGGTLTIADCTVSNNHYVGIWVDGMTADAKCVVTVTNCNISGNATGIVNRRGTLTAIHCSLNGNEALGMSNEEGSTLTALRCNVSGSTLRGLYTNGSGLLTATDCTLRGNGDGLDNDGGTVTVTGCTLSGNHYNGIANFNGGILTATNCTTSGNGYGLTNDQSALLTATHCTVSGNTDSGLYVFSGKLTLKNSIVVGNPTNVRGTFTNGGSNITSGTAAQAGLEVDGSGNPVLANNGGPTKTIKLVPGSRAVDKGNAFGETTDQRGEVRPYDNPLIANVSGGDGSDIGAFELGLSLLVNNPISVAEGSAELPGSTVFDIMLNAASTQTVTVKYRTRDGLTNPATAGSDYQSVGGTLTFAPGVTLKHVRVNFIGDNKAESKETFFLDLYSPTSATIADSRGVGTIANDDATPQLFEDDEPSE